MTTVDEPMISYDHEETRIRDLTGLLVHFVPNGHILYRTSADFKAWVDMTARILPQAMRLAADTARTSEVLRAEAAETFRTGVPPDHLRQLFEEREREPRS